jgi:hypothetical protein
MPITKVPTSPVRSGKTDEIYDFVKMKELRQRVADEREALIAIPETERSYCWTKIPDIKYSASAFNDPPSPKVLPRSGLSVAQRAAEIKKKELEEKQRIAEAKMVKEKRAADVERVKLEKQRIADAERVKLEEKRAAEAKMIELEKTKRAAEAKMIELEKQRIADAERVKLEKQLIAEAERVKLEEKRAAEAERVKLEKQAADNNALAKMIEVEETKRAAEAKRVIEDALVKSKDLERVAEATRAKVDDDEFEDSDTTNSVSKSISPINVKTLSQFLFTNSKDKAMPKAKLQKIPRSEKMAQNVENLGKLLKRPAGSPPPKEKLQKISRSEKMSKNVENLEQLLKRPAGSPPPEAQSPKTSMQKSLVANEETRQNIADFLLKRVASPPPTVNLSQLNNDTKMSPINTGPLPKETGATPIPLPPLLLEKLSQGNTMLRKIPIKPSSPPSLRINPTTLSVGKKNLKPPTPKQSNPSTDKPFESALARLRNVVDGPKSKSAKDEADEDYENTNPFSRDVLDKIGILSRENYINEIIDRL